MRQPFLRKIFKLLPLMLILVASSGCVSSGFAQSRSAGGPSLVGPPAVAVENARRDPKPPLIGRRNKVPAALATQSTPPDSANSADAPVIQPAPGQATAPAAVMGECDYWIVSSRNCDGKHAPGDAACCLSYFRCPSDQSFCPQPREAFLASVHPDRPICFVIHGSYNFWPDVMAQSRLINRWLRSAAPGAPLQVVFFTWPSDGYMPYLFPVDLAILGRRSSAHGTYLASLITQLPAEQKVSIIGHSHGARTAVAAFHALGGGVLENGQALPPGFAVPRHVRAVLIAAAIDHDWLNPGERYGQALLVPEKVLLLGNSRDATLGIYPLRKGLGDRALGRGGLGPDDRFVLGSLGPKVVEMDAAQFATWHHGFHHYYERPELAGAIMPYVYFQDTAAALGPANGPPASFPTPVAPPAKATSSAPLIGEATARTPTAREMWVDEPPPPEPRRNAVELRFEK